MEQESPILTNGITQLCSTSVASIKISDELFKRAFGSSPLRVLLVRIRTCKDVLLANDSGILPVRAFLPRSTYVSERVLPNECGMSPESLLLASSSVRSSARSPKAEVRSAIQGDMEPVIPSDERSRAVTRRGYCVLQVTPCQLQNSMDALLHEDKTSAELVSWDFKQRRACRSLSVSLLPMTSGLKKQNTTGQQRDEIL
uniref:Uncharacterized protein n=1 Tax=Oryza meridionalis TaxID=40149 RepID=A0A0E0E390_9ORYZ